MTDSVSNIEILFEKAENYAKTSIDLFKLQAIDKSSNVIASIISSAVIIIILTLSLLTLNIGLALWIGKLVGQNYYGFFIVGGGYAFITLILLIFKNFGLKKVVANKLMTKMLAEKFL